MVVQNDFVWQSLQAIYYLCLSIQPRTLPRIIIFNFNFLCGHRVLNSRNCHLLLESVQFPNWPFTPIFWVIKLKVGFFTFLFESKKFWCFNFVEEFCCKNPYFRTWSCLDWVASKTESWTIFSRRYSRSGHCFKLHKQS